MDSDDSDAPRSTVSAGLFPYPVMVDDAAVRCVRGPRVLSGTLKRKKLSREERMQKEVCCFPRSIQRVVTVFDVVRRALRSARCNSGVLY